MWWWQQDHADSVEPKPPILQVCEQRDQILLIGTACTAHNTLKYHVDCWALYVTLSLSRFAKPCEYGLILNFTQCTLCFT